jgi:hypothetical protein
MPPQQRGHAPGRSQHKAVSQQSAAGSGSAGVAESTRTPTFIATRNDAECLTGTGFGYRIPQFQASSHLIGWPITAPSATSLRLVYSALIFSTRNDRPRPFFLIPTPGSESHPAKGVTFCVRLAGDPFSTALGCLLVLSFPLGFWDFVHTRRRAPTGSG